MQALQFDLHLLAQILVERRQRLVHEQETRFEDDGARQRHALTLAARELRRPARGEVGKLDLVQGLGDPGRGLHALRVDREPVVGVEGEADTKSGFAYQDCLPLGKDGTPYRLVTKDFVSTFEAQGKTFLSVAPEALTLLTREAMRDIAHFLRPGHLAQLRKIIDDPAASANDRFVALDLLKNASIAAGGILPMCQDTGTAIVMGKKGQYVVTGGGDEAAISRGIFETYQTSSLRYSQLAPLDMWTEKNTGNNLPAQIELYATDGDAYKLLFMAKGGGSANKSYLYQETKALLNPKAIRAFHDKNLPSLGTAACPP